METIADAEAKMSEALLYDQCWKLVCAAFGIEKRKPSKNEKELSDFILSLSAVDIAVVYADRRGGYKFSVRSEVDEINAGKLIANALSGIGNGGGHPTMAGGVILEENCSLLGEDHDFIIRKRFLDIAAVMFEEVNK